MNTRGDNAASDSGRRVPAQREVAKFAIVTRDAAPGLSLPTARFAIVCSGSRCGTQPTFIMIER